MAARMIAHNGRTMCVTQWARELGISKQALAQRIAAAERRGLPIETALREAQRMRTSVPAALTRDGRTASLDDWAAEIGISRIALYQRVRRAVLSGVPPETALDVRAPLDGLTYAGRTQTMTAWAEELGITLPSLSKRVSRWGAERALMTPRARAPVSHGAITYRGRTQSLTRWAAEIGLSKSALLGRIERWGVERALSTPPMASGTRTEGEPRRRMKGSDE